MTLIIVLLLQNQSKSYQVKKKSLTALLGVDGDPCPPTPREMSSGKKAPACLDGAVGRMPSAARPSDVLLAEILGGRRVGLVTQSISWP